MIALAFALGCAGPPHGPGLPHDVVAAPDSTTWVDGLDGADACLALEWDDSDGDGQADHAGRFELVPGHFDRVLSEEWDDDLDGVVDRWTHTAYDADGHELRVEDQTGAVVERTWGPDGELSRTEDRDGDGVPDAITTFGYRDHLLVLETDDHGADGVVDVRTTYGYDAAGDLIYQGRDEGDDGVLEFVEQIGRDEHGRIASDELRPLDAAATVSTTTWDDPVSEVASWTSEDYGADGTIDRVIRVGRDRWGDQTFYSTAPRRRAPPTLVDRATFDAARRPLTHLVSGPGFVTSLEDWRYDALGRVVDHTTADRPGGITSGERWEYGGSCP